jgi:hypothetical protein
VANKDKIKLPRMTVKGYESLANCEDTFKLGFQLMNLIWPEEKWAEILGANAIPKLQKEVQTFLSQGTQLGSSTFTEMCYEKGWLTFVEQEEFFNPFISK